MLTKEQILGATDREFAVIDVPEWGGLVRIGSMSAYARDKYERAYSDISEGRTDLSIRAHLVAACVVDESGELLFTAEDVKALGQKSGAALSALFIACVKLNAMGGKDQENIEEK